MRSRLVFLGSALLLAGTANAAPKVVEANVAYVVDGDTAILEDGTTVHYLGISTPSKPVTGSAGEPFGQDAFELNKKLVAGKRVRLEVDAKSRDEKGALLAYVHVGKYFVNATLLQSGYARAAVRSPNTRYAGLFERLQAEAKDARRGLWNASRSPAPTFGNDALQGGAAPAAAALTNQDLEKYDVPGEDEALEQLRREQAARRKAEAAEAKGDDPAEDAEGESAEGSAIEGEGGDAAAGTKEDAAPVEAKSQVPPAPAPPAVPPQKP